MWKDKSDQRSGVRRAMRLWAAALIALASLASAATATKAAGSEATDGDYAIAASQPDHFVQQVADKVIALMERKDLSAEARLQRLRGLLVENIDLDTVSRAALGRYRRMATEQQFEHYRTIYPDYVLAVYSQLFNDYSEAKLEVKSQQKLDRSEALVKSKVSVPNEPSVNLSFRLRRTDDGYKIIDVLAEGVSMLVTQRSDFASVIQREGMDGFLTRMETVVRQSSPENVIQAWKSDGQGQDTD